VRIYDDATGNPGRGAGQGADQIALFYADASVQATVTGGSVTAGLTVTIDPATVFARLDRVVVTTPDFTTTNGAGANLTRYEACLLEVASFTPGNPATITFSTVAPYGRAAQDHCTGGVTAGSTMVYKFVARGYRIEPQVMPAPRPSRPELGTLQLSDTGGMFGTEDGDNWQPIAFGFTDIQTALRVYDANTGIGAGDFDSDGDANKEWLSAGIQTTVTDRTIVGLDALAAPLLMTISLVARTDRDVEGIGTAQTPRLIGPGEIDANPIGNHDSIDLAATADPALVPTSLDPRGSRIFRYLTFQVDFRNLGVGR
jgi:hypothetical protein